MQIGAKDRLTMGGKLTVGALIPNWYIGQPPTGPDISKYSTAAEDLGFDSIWAIDRLFGPHPVLEPYTSVGVPMSQRAGRFVEGVKIMKKLWSENNVTWQGKYQQLKEATILPK